VRSGGVGCDKTYMKAHGTVYGGKVGLLRLKERLGPTKGRGGVGVWEYNYKSTNGEGNCQKAARGLNRISSRGTPQKGVRKKREGELKGYDFLRFYLSYFDQDEIGLP